jgi:hypothetical protein
MDSFGKYSYDTIISNTTADGNSKIINNKPLENKRGLLLYMTSDVNQPHIKKRLWLVNLVVIQYNNIYYFQEDIISGMDEVENCIGKAFLKIPKNELRNLNREDDKKKLLHFYRETTVPNKICFYEKPSFQNEEGGDS